MSAKSMRGAAAPTCLRRRRRSLATRGGAFLLAAALCCAAPLGESRAQEGGVDASDALIELFARAQDGSGDPHLPYVLNDLKKALAGQNMLAFLQLVDPAYFSEQFGLLADPARSPGESLGQFSCEFFSICDVSKKYAFNDIVSGQVISVKTTPGAPNGLVEVRLELRMWDGLVLPSVIYFDPATARLSAARG